MLSGLQACCSVSCSLSCFDPAGRLFRDGFGLCCYTVESSFYEDTVSGRLSSAWLTIAIVCSNAITVLVKEPAAAYDLRYASEHPQHG